MPTVAMRELSINTSAVLAEVARTGRATLVTSRGRPMAAIVPLDDDALLEWVVANVPDLLAGTEGPGVALDEAMALLDTDMGAPGLPGPSTPKATSRATATMSQRGSAEAAARHWERRTRRLITAQTLAQALAEIVPSFPERSHPWVTRLLGGIAKAGGTKAYYAKSGPERDQLRRTTSKRVKTPLQQAP